MKHLLCVLSLTLLFTTCTSNPKAINSKDLKGKYEADFSSLLSPTEEEEDDFATIFAAMLLSSMQMTMQFEDTKLILDASEGARELINLASSDVVMPIAVDYTIKNDSLLYIRTENNDFQQVGILRKMRDSYDYLKYIFEADSESGETLELTLRRVTEK